MDGADGVVGVGGGVEKGTGDDWPTAVAEADGAGVCAIVACCVLNNNKTTAKIIAQCMAPFLRHSRVDCTEFLFIAVVIVVVMQIQTMNT